MADLYGTNGHRSSSLESEEMSSFLHNLLHSSSFKAKENSDFSDPGAFFPGEAGERTVNPFSSAGADSDPITSSRGNLPYNNNDANDFDFGSEEHEEHEVQANSVPPRSSKRTRAAEIHNLSEKRRRSRINEKLKALQNLIPNSNKTDKASMLDEAIEYLKQLQLQVQITVKVEMLTMRNGLGLTSDYLPETLQTVQLTQRGVDFDDGSGMMNANRGDTVSTDPKFLAQTALYMTNPAPRNQPIVIPLIRTINNSETSYELEPSIPNQYQLLNHLASSKDICRVDSASEVQFDINCSGKNSSSGIS